jgi:hypothetical protein
MTNDETEESKFVCWLRNDIITPVTRLNLWSHHPAIKLRIPRAALSLSGTCILKQSPVISTVVIIVMSILNSLRTIVSFTKLQVSRSNKIVQSCYTNSGAKASEYSSELAAQQGEQRCNVDLERRGKEGWSTSVALKHAIWWRLL